MLKIAIVFAALVSSASAATAFDSYLSDDNSQRTDMYKGFDAALADAQRRDMDYGTGYQGLTYVRPQAGCEASCISDYYNPMTGAHGSILVDPIPY